MKRLICLVALVPLLTACVGAGVISRHTATTHKATLAKTRGNIVLLDARTEIQLPGKATVRKEWGEPDKIEQNGPIERWIYNKDLTWAGVLIYAVVVPIPLLVPVGRDHLAIDFRNEALVAIEATGQGHLIAVCAVPGLVPHSSGCEAGKFPKDGQVDDLFIERNGIAMVGAQ